MTEITRTDLWKLFFGTQDPVGRIRHEDGYIKIRLRDSSTETAGVFIRRSIKETGLEEVGDILNDVSWSSVSLADYLLWILWVRVATFDIHSPLPKNERFNFAKEAFSLRNITDETITDATVEKTFDTLLRMGYLDEEYYPTSRGERIAKRMFRKTKNDNFVYVKYPQPSVNDKTKEEKPTQNREELEGRRLAAVKYAQKHPKASLRDIEQKYNLGEKTLSRNPYKRMIETFANARGTLLKIQKRHLILEKVKRLPSQHRIRPQIIGDLMKTR
jgi:hypothetical protein